MEKIAENKATTEEVIQELLDQMDVAEQAKAPEQGQERGDSTSSLMDSTSNA